MPDSAAGALLAALRTKLSGATTAVWQGRAYMEPAPPQAVRPFVVYGIVAGGSANIVRTPDAEFVFQVKCVADDMTLAISGQSEIANLLDDKGQQETADGLYGGTNWEISNCTEEMVIVFVEQTTDAQLIYHAGARYRSRMERIG